MRNKEQKTKATFLEEIMDICSKATDGIIIEHHNNTHYVNGLIKSSRRASQQAKNYNNNRKNY